MSREELAASTVLVTGGTGTLGRQVVERLRSAGKSVRVFSRRAGQPEAGVTYAPGDLLAGEGIAGALEGVRTIIHCASAQKGDERLARNLVQAAAARGEAQHLVFISIVGVDNLSFGYLRAKAVAERMVETGGIPFTILRATQFYDLILKGAERLAKLPVVPVPAGFLVQPVDAGEVAARLVEIALGAPRGRASDMGGPAVLTFEQAICQYLAARETRRAVLPLPLPGLRAIRDGGLLVSGTEAARGGSMGRRTWQDFLLERVCSSPHGA